MGAPWSPLLPIILSGEYIILRAALAYPRPLPRFPVSSWLPESGGTLRRDVGDTGSDGCASRFQDAFASVLFLMKIIQSTFTFTEPSGVDTTSSTRIAQEDPGTHLVGIYQYISVDATNSRDPRSRISIVSLSVTFTRNHSQRKPRAPRRVDDNRQSRSLRALFFFFSFCKKNCKIDRTLYFGFTSLRVSPGCPVKDGGSRKRNDPPSDEVTRFFVSREALGD